jgi:hypothetical protein
MIWSSLFVATFFALAGCQVAVVNVKKLEGGPGIPGMRQDSSTNGFYSARDTRSSSQTQEAAKQADPYRIKYHPSCSLERWMAVEGKLDNGRKYPVVLDTGASIALFVNDVHIIENRLAIHPLNSSGDSVGWGKCSLPELHIGPVSLLDWPCFYRAQHTEVRFLGLPLAKGNAIIAGLGTLRKFKYIAFDSINKEVEFSLEKIFAPEPSDSWAQYPFVIQEDWGGNVFLFVKIPVAGRATELQLDTGSGRGLAITEELWRQMPDKIQHVKLRKGRDLYPYIGSLVCRRGVAPRLEIGNRAVRNARISVFPDDSPIVDQCSGLVGMQYFQDTVMVLDFERNLMWVKNPAHPSVLPDSSI